LDILLWVFTSSLADKTVTAKKEKRHPVVRYCETTWVPRCLWKPLSRHVARSSHSNPLYTMFVFWNVMFFKKKIINFFYIYLLLEKLVNKKYFSVNRKYFSVKEKFSLVFKRVFSFLAVFVFRKVVSEKSLSKLSCVCLPLWKLINGKHFPVKEKFGLIFRKVFSWKIWAENTFPEVVKNLEMSLFANYIKFDP